MKTIIAMTTLAILCAGFIIVSFANQFHPNTDIAILRDITDKQFSSPKATEILPLFNLSADSKWNGATFRYTNVSDVSYNPTSEVSIEEANQLLSNEFTREKQIKRFEDSIATIISQALNDSIGKEYSSIYLPIANELNRLSASYSKRRILIVYSDLMENDLDLSLYSKEELQALSINGDSIKKQLEKRMPLPSLTGIDVYLIYQPTDAESDREFQIVSNFYRTMLEEKGATVHIAANLTKY